jgi:hypothetical protein
MHLLFSLLLISLSISSFRCQSNITYVFSSINLTTVETYLQFNGSILANTSVVQRLSTSGVDFLNSIQTILTANDTQSIAFSWNTGDCSFPVALALRNDTINVSSPICFTSIPTSIHNFLLLTLTSQELSDAAAIFMNSYSLTYFSIIMSSSSDFYFNLAQEFSTYLTEDSYILEQFIFTTSFTSTTVSSRSKGLPFFLLSYFNLLFLFYFSVLHHMFVYR